MTNRLSVISHLDALIREIPYAMLTTISSNGQLVSRPMTMQRTAFDGDLWFITDNRIHTEDDLALYPHVNLSMTTIAGVFISISGRAKLVTDPARISELWDHSFTAWFPGGMEDPNLTLLKITVVQADYWDSPATWTGRILHFANAVLLGTGRAASTRGHLDL